MEVSAAGKHQDVKFLKGRGDEDSHGKPRAGKVPVVLAIGKGGLLDFMSLIQQGLMSKKSEEEIVRTVAAIIPWIP